MLEEWWVCPEYTLCAAWKVDTSQWCRESLYFTIYSLNKMTRPPVSESMQHHDLVWLQILSFSISFWRFQQEWAISNWIHLFKAKTRLLSSLFFLEKGGFYLLALFFFSFLSRIAALSSEHSQILFDVFCQVHSFDGDAREAATLIDMDLYIGINGWWEQMGCELKLNSFFFSFFKMAVIIGYYYSSDN